MKKSKTKKKKSLKSEKTRLQLKSELIPGTDQLIFADTLTDHECPAIPKPFHFTVFNSVHQLAHLSSKSTSKNGGTKIHMGRLKQDCIN